MALDSEQIDVSVLIATFNSAATVADAIDSALAQIGVRAEILIADGASTDGTVEICGGYEGRLAYFATERDDGVYDAWNKIISLARGEWLCFLGSDDRFFSKDTLEVLLAEAKKRPTGVRLVYGQVAYVDSRGKEVYREGAPWVESRSMMHYKNSIPHIGTLHHRSIFDEGIRFDRQYRIAGDYDLVRRESLTHGAYFAAGVQVAQAGWGGLSTRPGLELRSVIEVGRVIASQDGRRPPLIWYLRRIKVGFRHAIYSAFGATGLARYERLKAWLGRPSAGSTGVAP